MHLAPADADGAAGSFPKGTFASGVTYHEVETLED